MHTDINHDKFLEQFPHNKTDKYLQPETGLQANV
jgi:hypothetical protein